MLPWTCNNGFALHCCRNTKGFLLLLTIISIEYYECVSAFLPWSSGMQIAPLLRRIVLLSLAFLFLPDFSILSSKGHDYRKNVFERTVCVFILYITFLWNISHSKKNSARHYHKCTQALVQNTWYSCQISIELEFSRNRFSRNSQMSNFMKIRPV